MFKGSNVALVTPFKNNKLDVDNYIELIHFHIKNGTNGLVPAGTTGESPTLSHEEHERVIELCVKESKFRNQKGRHSWYRRAQWVWEINVVKAYRRGFTAE